VLNAFDVGVFLLPPVNPNYEYALPNKLFEFIQARLAVAIGPSPDMAEVVDGHQCGIVSQSFSPEEFAALINGLTYERLNAYKRASHSAAAELHAEAQGDRLIELVGRAVVQRLSWASTEW